MLSQFIDKGLDAYQYHQSHSSGGSSLASGDSRSCRNQYKGVFFLSSFVTDLGSQSILECIENVINKSKVLVCLDSSMRDHLVLSDHIQLYILQNWKPDLVVRQVVNFMAMLIAETKYCCLKCFEERLPNIFESPEGGFSPFHTPADQEPVYRDMSAGYSDLRSRQEPPKCYKCREFFF